MKYRTFIALEAPAEARQCLAAKLAWLRPTPGVNWVREQNLHLTVAFLGDVDSELIPELDGIVDGEAGGYPPFPLALKGLELFPDRAPRLVWASLASQNDDLFRFYKGLLGALRREGFEPDSKPLKLHITLGRIKSALPPSLEREILQSEVEKSFLAYDTLTLYRSVLKPEGPSYHILKQYQLI